MNTRPTKFQFGSPTRQQGVKTDSPPRPKTPAPDKTGRLSIVEKPDQRPTSARTKAPLRRQRAATTLEQTTEGHSTQPGAPTLRGARGENSPPKSPSPSSSRTNERPPHQQDASRDESPKKVGFDRSLYVAGTDKKTGEKAFVHRGQMIPIKDPTPEKRSSQSRSQNARVPISRPKSIGTVVRRPEQDLPPLPFETKLDVIVKRVKKQPRTASERLSLGMGAVAKNAQPDAKTNLPQPDEIDPSIERKNTADLYNELDSYIEKFGDAEDATTSSSSEAESILVQVVTEEEEVVERSYVVSVPPIGGESTTEHSDFDSAINDLGTGVNAQEEVQQARETTTPSRPPWLRLQPRLLQPYASLSELVVSVNPYADGSEESSSEESSSLLESSSEESSSEKSSQEESKRIIGQQRGRGVKAQQPKAEH